MSNEYLVEENMQLTINFDGGLVDAYPTCREYVQARTIMLGAERGMKQAYIAADMEYAPGHLTRKLSQGDGDSARFTLDDFESWLRSTKDKNPLYYLCEKYLTLDDVDTLKAEILRLQQKVSAVESGRL